VVATGPGRPRRKPVKVVGITPLPQWQHLAVSKPAEKLYPELRDLDRTFTVMRNTGQGNSGSGSSAEPKPAEDLISGYFQRFCRRQADCIP